MGLIQDSTWRWPSRKSRRIYYGMQIILEDEDEKSYGGGADSMDSVIYTGRISRCIEIKHVRRLGGRRNII